MPHLRRPITLISLGGLIVLGAWLRLSSLSGRPFWRDEAWVALAVRDLSYPELLRQTDVPLPPLFGAATKLIGSLCGPPELSLRLLPALAGVAVLPLVYGAARLMHAPRSVALAATGLCAGSLMLVIWSRDLKQYSLEALASALTAWLVLRARRAGGQRTRLTLAIAIALSALVAPWLAYGAVFPLGGLLPLLLVRRPVTGLYRRSALLGATGLLALLIGVLSVWAAAARAQARDPALQAYSAKWYADLANPRSLMRVGAYAGVSSVMLLLPYDWFTPVHNPTQKLVLVAAATCVVLLAVVGACTWPRRGRLELIWWLMAPLLGMLVAAALHYYPFGVPRMMLFWAVPMLLALAMGTITVCRGLFIVLAGRQSLLWRRLPPAALATLLACLAPLLGAVRVPLKLDYWVHHDFPTLLQNLARQRLPGEAVLVELFAVSCVRYYAPHLAPPVSYVPTAGGTLLKPGADPVALARQVANTAGRRFWIIGTSEHLSSPGRAVLEAIRQSGFSVETIGHYGRHGTPDGAAELLLATRSRWAGPGPAGPGRRAAGT